MIKSSSSLCLALIAIIFLTTLTLSNADCTADQYQCLNSGCIDKLYVCDGASDCVHKDDENYCVVGNTSCVNGLFFCWASYPERPQCIRPTAVCDGYFDCLKHEDESLALCNQTVSPRCNGQQFLCSDGVCISQNFVCDGISDCRTGEDEFNCTAIVCPDNSFNCSHGSCIDASLACNGVWNCKDGSDEAQQLCNNSISCDKSSEIFCDGNRRPGSQCVSQAAYCNGSVYTYCDSSTYSRSQCGVDACQHNPCNTSWSTCWSLQIGYECQCFSGFRASTTTPDTCDDIDECQETPAVCPQLCTNVPGNYSCYCAADYIQTSDGQCQRRNDSITPYFVFGNRYYVRRMNLDGTNYDRFPPLLTFVHVLDFDWKSQQLFFVDITKKTINRMLLNGPNFTVIQTSSTVEGIAVDWIGRKLYWTSTDLQGIYVSEMNGSFVTDIFHGFSPYIRAIAVHPASRYLFWSDWSSSPHIGRAGMDGTGKMKLVTTGIFWPNGLTIDYTVNRVWWVEANLDRIEYMNLDGSSRHQLPSVQVSHPYGVTVFEEALFWTDWNFKSIVKADKYTGEHQVTLLNNLDIQPYDIKVIHPLRQPYVDNPCGVDNGNCSHLCLLAPNQRGYSCACPQAAPLLPDQMTCQINCSSAQFMCTNNDIKCIPWFYVCNGRRDCTGGEDEQNNCPSSRYCPSNQFQCVGFDGALTCLLESSICDGVTSCKNGEDEDLSKCSNRVCLLSEFLCPATGRCIPVSWVCDGQRDCNRGEDEAPANPNCGGPLCPVSYFACNNSKCIPTSWYCDVDDDCGDRSDEPSTCWQYRQSNPCGAGYRSCPFSYRCIPSTSFCDSYNDCRDNSDELPEYCSVCKPGEFTCNNKQCIPLRWKCDFMNDCSDKSDENVTMCNGNYRNCTEAEFRCNNSRCVSLFMRCDGNNDCIDNSDESNCGVVGCGANTFVCASGQCIDAKMRCDGHRDCPNDTSDEANCAPRYPNGSYCPIDKFTCNNTVCIDLTMVCDGVNDCSDGSDESGAVCAGYSCSLNDQFPCSVIHKCLEQSLVCDGVWNCPFGADENDTLCNNTCRNNEFRCQNGLCIPQLLQCDGQDNCGDGSDESSCAELSCSVCSQDCIPAAPNVQVYYCRCFPGYKVDPKNSRQCIDIDECLTLVDNWCPQTCMNRKATFNMTYNCVCGPGFIDLFGDGRSCVPEDGLRGTLLYSLGHEIRGLNMTIQETFIVTTSPDNNATSDEVQSIDVDAIRRHVYWVNDGLMRRAAIPQDSTQLPFVQQLRTVSGARGIAFDWITRNIYWTETNGVYVTSENVFMFTKTLQYSESSTFSPLGGIVVNPSNGTLYFVNNYAAMPSIVTMTMAGDNMMVLVDHEVLTPDGLTIDYNMGGRLFWSDQRKNTIESVNSDGSDRTVIVQSANFPYKVDIFAGKLYWTPASRNRILTVNLGEQVPINVISGMNSVGPIRYAHAMRYNNFTKNVCLAQYCTMCLLQPNGKAKCVCPDNMYPPGTIGDSSITCNIVQPPLWTPFAVPRLCTCQNNGYCVVGADNNPVCKCPAGFSGSLCQIPSAASFQPSSPNPSTAPGSFGPASLTPASSSDSSASSPSTISTSAAPTPYSIPVKFSSSSASTPSSSRPSSAPGSLGPASMASTSPSGYASPTPASVSDATISGFSPLLNSQAPNDAGKSANRDLSIALPIVLISVFIIVLVVLGVLAWKRGWFKACNEFGYKRQSDECHSPSPLDNLDFSNPVFFDRANTSDA